MYGKQTLYLAFCLHFKAILGFHGMLNQVQYHQAFVENKTGEEIGGFKGTCLFYLMLLIIYLMKSIQPLEADGDIRTRFMQLTFQGVAKHPELKLVPDEPANDTDVDGTLQKLMENDPGVTEVNLNNIKVILFMLHFVI